jgi:hypothetical protein
VNTILPEDPAAERFEALVDALGNAAMSGYETAALARIVSWSTDDDIAALARLVRQAQEEAAMRAVRPCPRRGAGQRLMRSERTRYRLRKCLGGGAREEPRRPACARCYESSAGAMHLPPGAPA